MRATRGVVVLGAALALFLPPAARSAEVSGASPPIRMAQDEGGPYGDGEVYGGYGSPDAGPGGYSGRRSRRHGRTVSYHGFRLVLTGPEGEAELAAAEHQIDIVDSAGMSASNMRLFRGRPIEVSGQGGSESKAGTSVVLGNLQGADSRPVLLHEYMHILHRSKIPGGFNNPTIEGFFEEARANNLYPGDSYMMANRREFFAVTASCFLYGTVERPPYNRETIRQQQPDYYAYLSHLFGRP